MTKRFVHTEGNARLVEVWTPWGMQAVPRKNSRAGRLESLRKAIRRMKLAKAKNRRDAIEA